jgi:hypothetical protein
MRLTGHVARVVRSADRVLVGTLRERKHLEDLDADVRIILNEIFKKSVRGLDFIECGPFLTL